LSAGSDHRVAVLGGGLFGCCLALALSGRGVRSTLYERHPRLLAGAASANEGKIHLGYVYALDRSLATARTMIRGALAFSPLVARYLGHDSWRFDVSDPFIYALHRDSILPCADLEAHLARVHAELAAATAGRGCLYPGDEPLAPPRRIARAGTEARFADLAVEAAFETSEIAIEPDALAAALRERIAGEPRIEVRTDHVVRQVADADRGLDVIAAHDGAVARDRFDHVVNGLWDGRIGLDAGRGLKPSRPWIYRRKYGVRFTRAPGLPALPTATFVLGPFGDLVTYASGLCYASWYPAGMTATSMGLRAPAEPAGRATSKWGRRLVADTLRGVGALVHPAMALAGDGLIEPEVRGGVIVAWGDRDIDDPASELHQRWDVGITSDGSYHSVDPGKYTLAPHFAECCAARLAGD
jgi:glycine/D-amino acid oxidase-like deaminating enzyme